MKFMLVLAVIVAAAWFYFKPLPPGQGPVAASAMRTSSGVVSAIEAYRSTKGNYPFTMEDMVPEFIGGVPHLKNGATIEYLRVGANYKLIFSYNDPLPAHCSHENTNSKPWTCEWM